MVLTCTREGGGGLQLSSSGQPPQAHAGGARRSPQAASPWHWRRAIGPHHHIGLIIGEGHGFDSHARRTALVAKPRRTVIDRDRRRAIWCMGP